jgi:hypothetical protein
VSIKEKWLLLVFLFAFPLLGMDKEARKNKLLFFLKAKRSSSS